MHVVVRPIITEKSLSLAAKGWYTFSVKPSAGKHAIASGVSSLYNVKVINVRTSIFSGKSRRVGRKMKEIVRSDWKKALVWLEKGQTIPVFDVTQKEKK